MTIPVVGSSTPYKKSSKQCPNCSIGAHSASGGNFPLRTHAEIRAALATMDIGRGSPVWRSARFHASRAGPDADADDLLQEAMMRALTTRKCSSRICIEHFITGIMRSLASAIIRTQEAKMAGPGVRYPIDIDQVASEAPSPFEELDRQSRSQACQLALDAIAKGRPAAVAIIDGLGQGLQGEALASFADIDAAELSNVRRFIKRNAAIVRTDDPLKDAA